MRRAALALLTLTMAFFLHAASARPILVIEATGNFYDSEAYWHPYHPWLSPEEYLKGNFSEKIMFDLNSCSLSKTGGTCNRIRAIFDSDKSSSWRSYNFDSGWFTPVSDAYHFSITPDGFDATSYVVYDDEPPPVGKPRPGDWGTELMIDLRGNWHEPFDDFSELYGKKLRVFQPGEDGYDGKYILNGSFMVSRDVPFANFTAETWFEHATIYLVPEPSSLALMSLAFASFVVARRRKS